MKEKRKCSLHCPYKQFHCVCTSHYEGKDLEREREKGKDCSPSRAWKLNSWEMCPLFSSWANRGTVVERGGGGRCLPWQMAARASPRPLPPPLFPMLGGEEKGALCPRRNNLILPPLLSAARQWRNWRGIRRLLWKGMYCSSNKNLLMSTTIDVENFCCLVWWNLG